jgi:ABC-type antimicrobial peptide transport system permease subunit
VGDNLEIQAWTLSTSLGHATAKSYSLKVSGLLKPTQQAWDRGLYTSLNFAKTVLAQSLHPNDSIWGADVLNFFLVQLKPIPNAAAALAHLINDRTVGEVIFSQKEIQRLQELTSTSQRMGFLLTLLILTLCSLTLTGLLLTRVDSMRIQFAVLRSLGYLRSEIASWLLWEGFILGAAAITFGALLEFIGFPFFRASLGEALPPYLPSYLWQSWPVWVATILSCLLAEVLPLLKIYRQDVHNSLREL